MSEGPPNRPVEVQIGGRMYRLRGDDPVRLARLAARVDATLRSIAGPDPGAAGYKAAVLTALNLAAQAEDERDSLRTRLGELQRRSRRLERHLENLAAEWEAASPPAEENPSSAV
ncbi:MAG: cell division protein ZapA [Acidobacteriota bacterium]|nr:cell division protein ZapA [Acidobacteriota bacterium]